MITLHGRMMEEDVVGLGLGLGGYIVKTSIPPQLCIHILKWLYACMVCIA